MKIYLNEENIGNDECEEDACEFVQFLNANVTKIKLEDRHGLEYTGEVTFVYGPEQVDPFGAEDEGGELLRPWLTNQSFDHMFSLWESAKEHLEN